MAGRPSGATGHSDRPSGRYTVRRGAKALIRTGSSVLLVEERHSDGQPFWTLPGGGVCADETLVEGLQRELTEELGCDGHVREPVTWFPYRHQGRDDVVSVYTVFDCVLDSRPEPDPSEGILACRWVGPDTVPPSTLPQVRRVCRQALG